MLMVSFHNTIIVLLAREKNQSNTNVTSSSIVSGTNMEALVGMTSDESEGSVNRNLR